MEKGDRGNKYFARVIANLKSDIEEKKMALMLFLI
jgi:hypothetical protein